MPSGATVRVFPTPEALTEAAARFVLDSAATAIAERGIFRIALAGGSTPRVLYARLALPDISGGVDWPHWHVYFGDERAVPPDDDASNYRMARHALLDRVPLPADNVHRISGELEPALAAERYASELGEAPLDLVLLGMGDDGHTASLFLDCTVDRESRLVVATKSPVKPHDRISLTLRALNQARAVLFLVTGASKAARLESVLSELARDAPSFPAAKVRPTSGALYWFLDAAAASRLSEKIGPSDD
jgi:6-phosphogluconolactonase